MLDGGGGGGSAGTNWNTYDVEKMWQLLANQETSNHWRQVSGWDKINELTRTHLSRLKEYRDSLASAWPPEKSAAAKAFVDRLDYLIKHIESVNEVAATNYSTFSTATGTLSTSRHRLKAIYDQYMVKKQQKQQYEADLAFAQNAQLPGTAFTTPKVTQADLDQLNYQARTIMFDLSSTLSQAKVQIKQPPPYKPPRASRDPGSDSPSSGGPTGGGAPPIPPVMPVPTPPPSSTPPVVPPGLTPGSPIPAPTAPIPGPILGGTGPLAPPAPPPTAPPVIAPPTTPSYPVGPLPGVPYGSPVTGLPGPGGSLPLPPNSTGPVKPGIGGFNLPRAMPPGGLIGGVPGGGLGQPGHTPPTRRINPVGGLISGTTPGAGGMARGMTPGSMGAAPHGASATGRLAAGHGQGQNVVPANRAGARRNDEDSAESRWDPDNPWQTDEGVAPVVLPAAETGRVDPGPAIGFHR